MKCNDARFLCTGSTMSSNDLGDCCLGCGCKTSIVNTSFTPRNFPPEWRYQQSCDWILRCDCTALYSAGQQTAVTEVTRLLPSRGTGCGHARLCPGLASTFVNFDFDLTTQIMSNLRVLNWTCKLFPHATVQNYYYVGHKFYLFTFEGLHDLIRKTHVFKN